MDYISDGMKLYALEIMSNFELYGVEWKEMYIVCSGLFITTQNSQGHRGKVLTSYKFNIEPVPIFFDVPGQVSLIWGKKIKNNLLSTKNSKKFIYF